MSDEHQHREIAGRLRGEHKRLPSLIDGELVSEGELLSEVTDPFTGEAIAELADGAAHVERAVAAAKKAQLVWAKTSPRDRGKAIHKLARALRDARADFIDAECVDAGVPKMLASRFSVAAMLRSYDYFAEWADKIYGEVVPTNHGVIDWVKREPVGVVASITAWNTPSLFLGSKVAPALAAGNAVIVKPSEKAPLPAHVFAQAVARSGLPKGLVSVVHGGAAGGAALVSHDDVDMVTFTGGSKTGASVAAAAGVKRSCLELGGKSAAVIFGDADLDQASFQLAFGSFGLSGQACAAASRLVIERAAFDAFVDKLATTATNMAMGDPLDAGTMLGPLIDEAALDRVSAMVERAKSEGAEIICGGERQGRFYKPTLMVGAAQDSEVAQQEIFGPVTCAFAFDKPAQAAAIANDTRYGLAASVWSKSIKRAHRTAEALAAGYVWINAYGAIPYTTPFGGIKASGHGREGRARCDLELHTAQEHLLAALTREGT